jgi:hypothetical protein
MNAESAGPDFVVRILGAATLALLSPLVAQAQATWDMTSLEKVVQPMEHSLDGFMPILPAGIPITNQQAAAWQPDGTLAGDVQALAARGIGLPVDIAYSQDYAGAVAVATTLQSLGQPVYVWSYIYGDTSGAPSGFNHAAAAAFWPLTEVPYPWAFDGNTYWPAYPLARPTVAYNLVRGNLQVLANAGIASVAGLFMDYEDYPVYWGDQKASVAERTYFSNYYTEAYASGSGVSLAQYGPDLLTDDTMNQNNPMWKYSYDLAYTLLKNSARQALTDVYGSSPIFGSFGAYFSTASRPFNTDGSDLHPPTLGPEPGIVGMPVAYADNFYLSNDFTEYNPNHVPVNQTTVDDVYWNNMFTQVSSSQSNDGSIGESVPWVSRYVPDVTSAQWVTWAISVPTYKELLRHIWLRGASGMYVFNPDRTPQDSFDELEYARSVLDEMLSFRTFLTNGAPMNFAVNSSLYAGGVEWSGMSNSRTNPTQWVVRTVSRTGSDSVVPAITPEPGLTFSNVPAPVGGATFILDDDGSMHRVDSRPATVFLRFDNNYQDSSGHRLNAAAGQTPVTDVPPALTTDVPRDSSGTSSLLDGAYGLYASRTNRYSVRLSRTPTSYANGSYIRIPDTQGAFDTPSFTVEAFVKVVPGISQDSASIISKGIGAPGGTDWAIQYRDFAGAGMVELSFYENSTTYAWIRTAGAPLTPGVWHNLAMTYDGKARQVTLYVDGVAQPFGNHDGQISAGGTLDWSFVGHRGDNIVLGEYDRGIDASFDDFRFTPEALDPMQMLTIGRLE